MRRIRSTNVRMTCIALASALCVPASAIAASADYFLKLEGVDGESKDDKHKGEIEILSWSWGATQRADALTDGLLILRNTDPPAAGAASGGQGSGKVNVHDISIMSAPKPSKVSKVEAISIKQKASAGGVNVAAGDVNGRAAPPTRTAGSLTTLVPAGRCRVGASYPSAKLGTPGRVYRLEGVTVASCAAASSGGQPMESISLNYTKIMW